MKTLLVCAIRSPSPSLRYALRSLHIGSCCAKTRAYRSGAHPASAYRSDRRCGCDASLRWPSATARTIAAARSSRPLRRCWPSPAFASFSFAALSATTFASAKAARMARLTGAATRPSSTADLKPRTSIAPSRQPWPRHVGSGSDKPASRTPSSSSPARQRSAAMACGRP